MRTLTDRQQAALARGLATFDSTARRRRLYRTTVRGAVVAIVLVTGGVALEQAARSGRSELPSYVELVRDDRQLVAELELANACERVNRSEGRLVIVECVVPELHDSPTSAGEAVRPVG